MTVKPRTARYMSFCPQIANTKYIRPDFHEEWAVPTLGNFMHQVLVARFETQCRHFRRKKVSKDFSILVFFKKLKPEPRSPIFAFFVILSPGSKHSNPHNFVNVGS